MGQAPHTEKGRQRQWTGGRTGGERLSCPEVPEPPSVNDDAADTAYLNRRKGGATTKVLIGTHTPSVG
jgi:hypothetical protein